MTEQQQRCQETRQLLAKGAHLVDVRTPAEYHSGALQGAINLPLHSLFHIHQHIDKEDDIVVYCVSGQRSNQAKQLLEQMGYNRVHDLGSYQNILHC